MTEHHNAEDAASGGLFITKEGVAKLKAIYEAARSSGSIALEEYTKPLFEDQWNFDNLYVALYASRFKDAATEVTAPQLQLPDGNLVHCYIDVRTSMGLPPIDKSASFGETFFSEYHAANCLNLYNKYATEDDIGPLKVSKVNCNPFELQFAVLTLPHYKQTDPDAKWIKNKLNPFQIKSIDVTLG